MERNVYHTIHDILETRATATRPEIEWRSIAAIGNVLRHEYHTISDKIAWDVIQVDLPSLNTAIRAIAASDEKPGSV
jgi:uncharacterized protein with HEPN domain